jgi:hypothetical protein
MSVEDSFMAHAEQDVHGLRLARTELSKRGIDTSRADVRVMHGVCYIRGIVGTVSGSAVEDLHTEMEHIRHILRQKPNIRDVVLDCQFAKK